MYQFSNNRVDKKITKKLLAWALISGIPFIGIIIFSYFGWEEITTIDYQISSYFYQLHSPGLNSIMTIITHMGDLITQTLITIFAIGLLFIVKKWRTAFWYGLTVAIGAGGLNLFIKEFYERARPSQIQPLVAIGGYSFPSGHSMGAMIVYGGLLFLALRFLRSPQLKILLSVVLSAIILMIGLSRIYLGVHFPTDVIGGFSLGLAWLLLSIAFFGMKSTDSETKSRNLYSIKRL